MLTLQKEEIGQDHFVKDVKAGVSKHSKFG